MRRATPFALVGGLAAAFLLAGCSTGEENPVTPDKMNEIRAKEAQDRANFHPDMTPKPASAKP